MSDELTGIALELRRHLAWQEAEGGRLIYREFSAQPAKAALTDQGLSRNRGGGQAPALQAAELRRAGACPLPNQGAAAPPHEPRPLQAAPRPLASPPPAQVGPPPILLDKTLDEVRRELGDCTRCQLCKGRVNIVFGVGNPKAELVFVGEGPGQEEDLQGVPFVGKAGQLLTKMIEAMKFSRDEVYLCNVVKCRPPNNRNPEAEEIAACEPFLEAQLAAIKPKVIVALGKFATQVLLRDSTPITRLRGQWRRYEGVELMPTFHPAYLLRTPAEKKLAWLDLQDVMKKFGKLPT